MNTEHDLLIYGAGRLGTKVGLFWKKLFPDSRVTAVTSTTSRRGLPKSSYVLFAVPPVANYEALVTEALKLWNEYGGFVFTSSTSVFLENSNGKVTERSKLNPQSPIFPAEKLVEQDGGCIVRLAGLYDNERGPQFHLKKTMKINSSKTSYLNLIHTDDAASLCVTALQFGKASAHYLGCDNRPIKKIDFAQLVLGEKAKDVEYVDGPDTGKQCDCTFTMRALEWAPKHVLYCF